MTSEEKRRNKITRTWERFKALTVGKCKNDALKEFQKLRRLQDVGADGRGPCISCGKICHFSEADAGHMISRKVTAVAFWTINVNLQCKYCNQHCHGALAEYRKGLVAKYGELPVLLLETRRDDPPLTLSKYQFASMREIYKELQKPEKERMKL